MSMINFLLPATLTTDWALLLVVSSFITSAMTAAFGIGGGVALLTIMLLVLPPAVVLPLHGVVQTGSNAGRAWVMRHNINWRAVGWFSLGSGAGVALASQVYLDMPVRIWSLGLAAFILWSIWSPRLVVPPVSGPGFIGVGAVASFLTLFFGATGPLVAVFWDTLKLDKLTIVATHGAVMTVQHTLKVIAFGLLGFVFHDWLPLVLLMICTGYLGTLAGRQLLGRLPDAVFASAFKWLLTLLAVRLVWIALQSGATTP